MFDLFRLGYLMGQLAERERRAGDLAAKVAEQGRLIAAWERVKASEAVQLDAHERFRRFVERVRLGLSVEEMSTAERITFVELGGTVTEDRTHAD